MHRIVGHMLLMLTQEGGSLLLQLLLLLLMSLEGGQFVVLVQRGRSAEHYLSMLLLLMLLLLLLLLRLIHLFHLDESGLLILLRSQVVGWGRSRGLAQRHSGLVIRILQTNNVAVTQGR